jgi:hypothetical protein
MTKKKSDVENAEMRKCSLGIFGWLVVTDRKEEINGKKSIPGYQSTLNSCWYQSAFASVCSSRHRKSFGSLENGRSVYMWLVLVGVCLSRSSAAVKILL